MFDDTTGSLYASDGDAERPLVVTVVAHPDLERIGDCATLDVQALKLGIGRNLPELVSPMGVRRPLGAKRVSRTPFTMERRPEGLWIHPHPALEIDGRSLEQGALITEAQLERGVLLGVARSVLLHLRPRPEIVTDPVPEIGGHSPDAQVLHRTIRSLARLRTPVLVSGPSTRVEQVCVALHQHGPRAEGPLIEVGLAGVADAPALHALLHGSGMSPGRLQLAEGGTLWLRALDDLDPRMVEVLHQAIGGHGQAPGTLPYESDVRFLGSVRSAEATDSDLAARFTDHIDVVADTLPQEDMAWHFGRALVERLRQLGRDALIHRDPAWLPPGVMLEVLSGSFPGGIAEVQAAARRMAVTSPDSQAGPLQTVDPEPTDEQRDELYALLEANDFRITATADAAGLSPNTLRKRMREAGLKVATELTMAEIDQALRQGRGDQESAARTLGVSVHGLRMRINALQGS